ncbi:MAG: PhoU domain-containing protein [Candidatus Neomarinimicrobiota bacterium]|nr:PhoU domain-containing protein [Candidatus Neomarinimicrobiota bacterium]
MWKELTNLWRSDDLLQQAWSESYEMLEIAQKMYVEAVRILRESEDTVINLEIRQKDKEVNKYEQEVRRKVMTHCTLQGSEELPGGMVLVSIVIDIERIGDYCKNILDLAEVHPAKLTVGAYENSLYGIEKEVRSRFGETISVLRNQDVVKAHEMMGSFKVEISGICDNIVDELAKESAENLSSSDAVALALYVRYLKRISAHLNNMITSVVNPFERIGFRAEDNNG